ncbi:MAG: hypothetical protein N3E42_01760 [Candidatus Bipolaricaulota bacterium]|nr:hypothetical protein [Candidatus Bipolaricaulota bacterium]
MATKAQFTYGDYKSLPYVERQRFELLEEDGIHGAQAQTVDVLTLGEQGYERVGFYHKGEMLESPLLPGLSIPLRDVF